MATVTLSDGRTLELRPMYISEKLAIVKLQEQDDEQPYIDIIVSMSKLIEPAVTAKSWDGPLLDMTELQLLKLARSWSMLTEEDAIPPALGTDSETT